MPIVKNDVDGDDVVIRPPGIRLTDMHVRGDRLLMMIEEGPYNLRNVLKGETLETFNDLACKVLGAKMNRVEAVAVWLRKLLRYPSRSTPRT